MTDPSVPHASSPSYLPVPRQPDWDDGYPVVADQMHAWPIDHPPTGAIPAVVDQSGTWTVDPVARQLTGSLPVIRERERAWPAEAPPPIVTPVPAHSGAWPIDRPLTGSFPIVPTWGIPLHTMRSRSVISGRAGRDGLTRSGLVVAGWLLLLLLAWTWIAGGALHQLVTGEAVEILRACGHLAALVASGLLLVQVVLMARLPALENTIGRDRLVRIHARVGVTSFCSMLAHIVLATLVYAGARISAAPETFWDITWHLPGMLLAVAGTLALVMVVVTSSKRMRRRIDYESWHLLHLYGYLGAGLALPHQLWTGRDFLRSPFLTFSWWAAWGLVAGGVILWRLLIPLVRSIQHDVRVAGVVREGPRMVSVYLTGRRLDELAEAGQFLTWRFVDRPGWMRANPFSISAAPLPDRLRITVREAGDGSRSLADLEPGTRVLVEGAYGRLTARARTHRKVALIGAGSGMAPLRALAEGLAYAPEEVILLERYTDEPYLPEELEWLARERGLRLVRLPGRRRGPDSWVGEGYDEDDDAEVVRGWIPDLEEHDVFVCGAAPWAESVRRAVLAAGLPPAQLHVEAFGW